MTALQLNILSYSEVTEVTHLQL